MKKAKISELKNNLSRYLAYVRRGGTVRIFDRDVPVADLVPLVQAGARSGDGDSVLAGLERAGLVRRGTGKLPKGFLTRKLPRSRASVVAALLDERRESR
jgi:antitoxin (DNA-binding transcriptional repressor) of toxin-antitoxin stability system